MSLCTQLLRSARLSTNIVRKFTVVTEVADQIIEEPIPTFRTIESNPAKHTTDHLHRFYTISPEIQNQLFKYGGLTKAFRKHIDTFVECCILVRSPVVEVISYLNQTDYTRPPNKYVFYGELGTGKSMSLAHIIHYALMTKKIIVHAPWLPEWFLRAREYTPSVTREGYYDLPVDAAAWLVHFKHQNGPLLAELDLKLSKDYEWSSREITTCGSPLIDLIDLGISRLKYACDIIYALTDELKLASTANKCQTLVAIDGFNAFFADNSIVKNENRKIVKPMQISLTSAFLNMTNYDWCNGAIVVTVDPMASLSDLTTGLPRFLLGKEGFEHLDPFMPILIENYTIEEFEATMDYYKDRKWLRNISKEGQREIELVTARNPFRVMMDTIAL